MAKKYNTFMQMLLDAGFNIPVDLSVEKMDYKNLVFHMDFEQATGRYVWGKLPEGITSHLIETMVYFRGSLGGFYNGGKLKVLPYANSGSINEYGYPTKGKPLTFNGTSADENKPYGDGQEYDVSSMVEIKPNGMCLLFDRNPVSRSGLVAPRFITNAAIIDLEAEIISRIKSNIKNSDKKVVFYADDANQKTAFETAINEAYTADSPFIVVVRGSNKWGKDNTDYMHGEVGLKAQELFESWQSVNNIRVMSEGIINGGAFEKKERVVNAEVQDESTQTSLILNSGLLLRKLWLEEMKLTYPQYREELNKITVEIASTVEYKSQNENERQDNKEEEEE